VVAGSVDVDGKIGELVDDAGRHAEAGGCVLDIDRSEVDLLPVDHGVELLVKSAAARLADDVTDVE